MSGGGTQTQTTTSSPWAGAEGYLKDLLAKGSAIAGSQTGEDYQQKFVGLTPEQTDAVANMQRYFGEGGGYQQGLAKGQSALDAMLADPSAATQTPEVQAMIASAQQPMLQQLTEQVMPNIRAGATGAGQYGSTRQGVAEGVATGKTEQAMGDVATGITGNVYQQALANRMKATQLAPMFAEAGAAGQKQQLALGDILRQAEQGQVDTDLYNRTAAQWAPLQQWSQMLYPAAGMGGTSTTQVKGAQPGFMQKLLGAGTTGLGAYATLAGLGGGAATGALPVGLGAGLLGLLS